MNDKHINNNSDSEMNDDICNRKIEIKESMIAKKDIDDFYVQAWDEIKDQTKTPSKSLWAKAFAISQGDEKKTQATYIEYRVAQLKDEYEQMQNTYLIEAEKKAQIEAAEAKMKLYKESLQSKNTFSTLRPLAEKIKTNAVNNDVTEFIEKLGGRYDVHKSDNGKWYIKINLAHEKLTFSGVAECISWLRNAIVPLVLEDDGGNQDGKLEVSGHRISKLAAKYFSDSSTAWIQQNKVSPNHESASNKDSVNLNSRFEDISSVNNSANVSEFIGDIPVENNSNYYEALIGDKNSNYYLTKFEEYDRKLPGFTPSWNWPAFFLGGTWALYRKMYGWFFAFLGIIIVSGIIEKEGAALISFILLFAPWVAFTILANSLYHKSVKGKITNAQRSIRDKSQLLLFLRRKGGVHTWVIWVCCLLPIIGILSAIVIPQFVANKGNHAPSIEAPVPPRVEAPAAPEPPRVPEGYRDITKEVFKE